MKQWGWNIGVWFPKTENLKNMLTIRSWDWEWWLKLSPMSTLFWVSQYKINTNNTRNKNVNIFCQSSKLWASFMHKEIISVPFTNGTNCFVELQRFICIQTDIFIFFQQLLKFILKWKALEGLGFCTEPFCYMIGLWEMVHHKCDDGIDHVE